jgi:hypothetical protein
MIINKYNLPKIIWTHWDDMENTPLLIKNIFELREKKLTDWKIHVLNNTNISQYIDENMYPKNYNNLLPSQKSDWIRLYLLKKYGGVWLDAGIIINDSNKLNEMYESSIHYKSELTGYYLNGSTINNDPSTFFESWFIMAPINSRIIDKWLYEFEEAIHVGFSTYKNDIIKKGVDVSKIYMYGPDDTYLTIHATLQKILQLNEIKNPKMLLYKAEDSMYKLHQECNWDSPCIYNKIRTDNLDDYPMIKLRGIDRGDGNFMLIN